MISGGSVVMRMLPFSPVHVKKACDCCCVVSTTFSGVEPAGAFWVTVKLRLVISVVAFAGISCCDDSAVPAHDTEMFTLPATSSMYEVTVQSLVKPSPRVTELRTNAAVS